MFLIIDQMFNQNCFHDFMLDPQRPFSRMGFDSSHIAHWPWVGRKMRMEWKSPRGDLTESQVRQVESGSIGEKCSNSIGYLYHIDRHLELDLDFKWPGTVGGSGPLGRHSMPVPFKAPQLYRNKKG